MSQPLNVDKRGPNYFKKFGFGKHSVIATVASVNLSNGLALARITRFDEKKTQCRDLDAISEAEASPLLRNWSECYLLVSVLDQRRYHRHESLAPSFTLCSGEKAWSLWPNDDACSSWTTLYYQCVIRRTPQQLAEHSQIEVQFDGYAPMRVPLFIRMDCCPEHELPVVIRQMCVLGTFQLQYIKNCLAKTEAKYKLQATVPSMEKRESSVSSVPPPPVVSASVSQSVSKNASIRNSPEPHSSPCEPQTGGMKFKLKIKRKQQPAKEKKTRAVALTSKTSDNTVSATASKSKLTLKSKAKASTKAVTSAKKPTATVTSERKAPGAKKRVLTDVYSSDARTVAAVSAIRQRTKRPKTAAAQSGVRRMLPSMHVSEKRTKASAKVRDLSGVRGAAVGIDPRTDVVQSPKPAPKSAPKTRPKAKAQLKKSRPKVTKRTKRSSVKAEKKRDLWRKYSVALPRMGDLVIGKSAALDVSALWEEVHGDTGNVATAQSTNGDSNDGYVSFSGALRHWNKSSKISEKLSAQPYLSY